MAGSLDPRDADRAQVASSLSGGARDVVQARDISGGVHFHALATVPAERGPRHLLPGTALFTGRNREMDALLGLAGQAGSGAWPGAVVISAIDGMGGVGKTALALHAAHRLADRFPDGHLFINLAGFTAGRQPLDPAQALAELLRGLGIPPQLIPETLEARAAFYRDRLHGTRTLIVLDNAASEDQVRPLLPGTGSCLVLVTSRRRLAALDDALPLPLDVLAPAEAVTLLRRAARLPASTGDGDSDGETRPLEQVAGLCGYLPLALLIAAALQRAHGRAWTLDHLIARLAARPPGRELAPFDDGTRNLTALFDISYHALAPARQEFYRRLGVLPGPEIDGYAAAALLASDPEQAGAHLEQLAGCSLLEAASPGRYRMHDLLRAHARTLAAADPDSSEAARARLYHYYQYTAGRAATLTTSTPRPGPGGPAPAYAPLLPGTESAWAWLRTERANLQAAIDHAGRRNLGPDLITLTAGLGTILYTDGPWPQAVSLHETAAATAGRLGDHLSQADALTDLGRVRQLTGDFPGAADALTRALQAYHDLGDRLGQANALTNLGDARRLTGDYPGAADALTRALQAYHDLGDRLGQSDALISLGIVRQLTGDFPGAADALTRALRAYHDLGDRLGQASALTYLGEARRLTGDYPGAADALAQALQTFRDFKSCGDEAQALNYYAAAVRAGGDLTRALELYQQALAMNRELGKPNDEATALEGTGECLLAQGRTAEGTVRLHQALDLYQRLGMRADTERLTAHLSALARPPAPGTG